MNDLAPKKKSPKRSLNPIHVKDFILTHLNRIYCAKSHLLERLPELAEQTDFNDLQNGITAMWKDLSAQTAVIEEIYELMGEQPSFKYCDELIEFVENGFTAIYQQSKEPKLRDLSILFYLSMIESVELASCKLLKIASANLHNFPIKRLLTDNFGSSKARRAFVQQLTALHI